MNDVPTAVSAGNFRCRRNLKELYLNKNCIKLARASPFRFLTQLNILNLKYNLVRRIQLTTFRGLCRLINLDLSNNQIIFINVFAFSHMSLLQELKLSGNKLIHLGSNAFPRLANLYFLNISSNNLKTIPFRCFSRLLRLQTLDLSNNAFTRLTITQFSGTSYILRDFSVSYNHLSTFAFNFFDLLIHLHKLNISGNPIQCLPKLSKLKQLRELDIMNTEITHIYPCDLQGLDNLEVLFWSGSPITCDCQNMWVKGWYDSAISTWSKEQTNSKYHWTCASPQSTLGMALQNIHKMETSCTQQEDYCYVEDNCHNAGQSGGNLFPNDGSSEQSEEETDESIEQSDGERDGGQVTETTTNLHTEDSMADTSEKTTGRNGQTTHEEEDDDITTIMPISTEHNTENNATMESTAKETTKHNESKSELTTAAGFQDQTGKALMQIQNEEGDVDPPEEEQPKTGNTSMIYKYKIYFVIVCTAALLVIITCICCAVLYVMKKKHKMLQERDNKVHVIFEAKNKEEVASRYRQQVMLAPPSYVNVTNATNESMEAMFQQDIWNEHERKRDKALTN